MKDELTDKSVMEFGIHKDSQLADVPAQYLMYIYENYKLKANLKKYIQDNLDVLKVQMKRDQKDK